MKKTILIIISLIFLAAIAYAYPLTVTLNGNTQFITYVYHCTNPGCSAFDKLVANLTGTKNVYTITNYGPGSQYFAEFDFTADRCYSPQDYINWFSATSGSKVWDLAFAKKTCNSSIVSFSRTSFLDGRQEVNASIASPLIPPSGAPAVIPAELQNYYSANVKVDLSVFNSSNSLIYSASSNQDILTGTNKQYSFSFPITKKGSYKIIINPYSTECLCSSNINNQKIYNFNVTQNCFSSNDCGNSSLINNYCSGNNVYSNYSVPGCESGSCSLNYNQILNQTCNYGCNNGICLQNIACNQNSDCGNNIFLNQLFCQNNNVFDKFLTFICNNPGTILSYCSNSTQNMLNKTCSFGCLNGLCLNECTLTNLTNCGNINLINNYCSGNNVYSNYSVPGCEDGSCSINFNSVLNQTCQYGCNNGECKPRIACNDDSECQPWPFECQGNFCFDEHAVYQRILRGSCILPGTILSYCDSVIDQLFWKNCNQDEKCAGDFPDAHCENISECNNNSDCGQNTLINNYCYNDNVYSNYSIHGCLYEECSIAYNSILNQTCEFGCNNRACNPGTCELNSDCGNITSQLICSGNNKVNQTTTPGCSNNSCSSNITHEVIQNCGNESYSSSYCYNGNVARNHFIPGCSNASCLMQNISETVASCSHGCENAACKPDSGCGSGGCGGSSVFHYCGDRTCNSGENEYSCPEDCGITIESSFNVIRETNENSSSLIIMPLTKAVSSSGFSGSMNWVLPIVLVLLVLLLIILIFIIALTR